MTRTANGVSQAIAVVGQLMMDPAQAYFGWSPELTRLLHAGLACGQALLGILAHSYNSDGSRSE